MVSSRKSVRCSMGRGMVDDGGGRRLGLILSGLLSGLLSLLDRRWRIGRRVPPVRIEAEPAVALPRQVAALATLAVVEH
jgi:hypothetical protein